MTEQDDILDRLLADSRSLAPIPSEALMMRILEDATAVAAKRARPAPRPAPAGWATSLAWALGGWLPAGAASGTLAASTIAGIWIGAAQPQGLSSLTSAIWGESVSVAVGADEDPLSLLGG